MIKIYIIMGFILIVLGAYWAGARNGAQRCRADAAVRQQMAASALQNEITLIKGKINEETYHAATVDIRIRLRDKYSIKD